MLNLFLPIWTVHRDDALQTGSVGEEAYLLLKKAGEEAREKSQQAK